jgi:hypothetical protein
MLPCSTTANKDVQIAQPDPPADAAVPIEGLGAHLYAYRKIALLF